MWVQGDNGQGLWKYVYSGTVVIVAISKRKEICIAEIRNRGR